ncbi:MAG: ClpXP protease specificity-enhancing factor SspB [Rhodospirillales bacterium]|nr:ClpXP protease specificity-enhancing factor SspB [Rhodospirillales bacterium]
MTKKVNEINYDKLIEKALKHVVIEALKIVENQGLPGDQHFYIAFRTDHPDTKIDPFLKSQYPKEMTIVLQNQFEGLKVTDEAFSVILNFNHVPYRLEIPFDAVTYFGDPSVRFGLSFGAEINDEHPENEHQKAEVVSIDSFRKKNA